MTINLQQLTAIFPLLIIMFTAIIVILSISYHRNHFFIATLSIAGLATSFFSLYPSINIAPISITNLFCIDSYSILYIGMIIISSISSCVFAYPWLQKFNFNKEEFYLLIVFSTLGSISLIISNHMASFFVSIELLSLPIFGLIAYSSYQKYSLEAGFKYIILSGVASSFLLLGIAWIYSISGNLSVIYINQILDTISEKEKIVVLFGFSMVLFSIFFKLSIVPFHLWTPDIYQGTPASVLSFFSTASKISIFIILIHFLSHISYFNNSILYFILSSITFFSILLGNIMALFQKNLKRFFGYSSISQLGYLLVILLVSEKNYFFSLETSGIYLFTYLFSNIACFGIINLIENSHKKNDLDFTDVYKGLFWSQPVLSSILTVILFSLAGIPATLGFISKFYILSIIIKEHLWIIGISFLIGTILGIYCYLRIVFNLYFHSSDLPKNSLSISRKWFYTPSGILIIVSGLIILILGIYPNPIMMLFKINS